MPIDITDQPRRVQYAISGTGPYDFDFEVLEQADIAVYRDATPLALTAGYTVTINADGTGAVTLVSATGTTLTVLGARPYRRTTDYAVGGDFTAPTINYELDSFQIQILQLREEQLRALRMSLLTSYAGSLTVPDPGAGYYWRWNATGTALEAVSAVNDPGSFLASGAGAVSRSVTSKLAELGSSVKDDGAVGDGVADDATEITSTKNDAEARIMSGNSGIYGSAGAGVGSAEPVLFPKGVYKIGAAITPDTNQAINYFHIKGEGAILVLGAGITAFGGVGYDMQFTGLKFRDGACALSLKSNNVNSTQVDIDRCEFHNQNDASIKSDALCASSIVTITRSKFYNYAGAGAYALKLLAGDGTYLEKNWMQVDTAVAIYNACGNLVIRDLVGVPGPNLNNWVENHGSVDMDCARLGGEDGGAASALIANYTDMDVTGDVTPTHVILRNCPAYSNAYAISFVKLPNIVQIENVKGLIGTLGFSFDAALTYVDFFNFQGYGQVLISDNYVAGGTDLLGKANNTTNGNLGLKVFNAMRARDGNGYFPRRDRLREADIFGSGGVTISGWTVVDATLVSTATTADAYGVDNYVVTATAGDANVQFRHNTYLDKAVLVLSDIYTFNMVIDVVVVGTLAVSITIGGSQKQFVLATGKHIVSVPFVYLNGTAGASSTYDSLIVTAGLRSNLDVVKFGRHILVKGLAQYTKEILVLEDNAAPAGYTDGIGPNSGYYRGDVSYRTNVAAAGPWGDVCTTAGAPGTWKAAANVAA